MSKMLKLLEEAFNKLINLTNSNKKFQFNEKAYASMNKYKDKRPSGKTKSRGCLASLFTLFCSPFSSKTQSSEIRMKMGTKKILSDIGLHAYFK